MSTKEAIKVVEQSGTKVSKDKIIDALKRLSAKELPFVKDIASGYSILLLKIG